MKKIAKILCTDFFKWLCRMTLVECLFCDIKNRKNVRYKNLESRKEVS